MKVYDGSIEYNKALECYGLMGLDGKWIREELKDGDRIAIMIGNDVFHTDFKEGFSKPFLQPLPWDNWDLLVGKPVAYYDFETPPPAPKKQISNKKAGLMLILIGAAVCLALGAVFSLPFGFSFINAVAIMYAFFGISFTLAGLLMIVSPTMCEKGYAIGFGIALHYGTAILGGKILPVFGCEDPSGRLLIAFVIVAMACYIMWLLYFKGKYHDKE